MLKNILKISIIIILISLFFIPQKNAKNTVKFASWGSKSELEILIPILDEFEKQNPNIKVEFIHIPQNYFQKIHLLFASNLAPDVIFINNLYLPFFADANVLEPLKSTNEFYPKSLKSLSYNGNLYAIPRDISNLVVYINKDLFNKYNVKIPNKNWDFTDLLTISEKLTTDIDNDGKIDIFGISFEETPALYYLPYLMSEGGGILTDDLSPNLDSEESQKGLKFYSDLRNKYHVAPTKAESASVTMAQLFLQQRLAMQISGRWLVPKYSKDADFNWTIINFPNGSKGSIVPLDASGWAIAKSSKNKTNAIKLIEFLSSKENIEKFAKSGLIVPARIDVAKEFAKENKVNKTFVSVIETSKPTRVSSNYNEILDNIDKKVQKLFNLKQ